MNYYKLNNFELKRKNNELSCKCDYFDQIENKNLSGWICSKIVNLLSRYCPEQPVNSVVAQLAKISEEGSMSCVHLAAMQCVCEGGKCAVCTSNAKNDKVQNGDFNHHLDKETIKKNDARFTLKFEQLKTKISENSALKLNPIHGELKSMLTRESQHVKTKGRVAHKVNAWCQCADGDGKCPFDSQTLQAKSCGAQLAALEHIFRTVVDKKLAQDPSQTHEIYAKPYRGPHETGLAKLFGAMMCGSTFESGYHFHSMGHGASYSSAYLFESDKSFHKEESKVSDFEGLSAEDVHGINLLEIETLCDQAFGDKPMNVTDSFLMTLACSVRYARDGAYSDEMSMLAAVLSQCLHDVEDYFADVKKNHNTFLRSLVAQYGADKASEILAQISRDVMSAQLIGAGEDAMYSVVVWSLVWCDSKAYSEVAGALGIPLEHITMFTQAMVTDRIDIQREYFLQYRNILWGTLRNQLQLKGWWYHMIVDHNALYGLLPISNQLE